MTDSKVRLRTSTEVRKFIESQEHLEYVTHDFWWKIIVRNKSTDQVIEIDYCSTGLLRFKIKGEKGWYKPIEEGLRHLFRNY